jgi:hypothetical protein
VGDLQRSEAIGRRWMSSRTEQIQHEMDERRAVEDLCDVDPWAKPDFHWCRKKDAGKDRAVRLLASSPGRPRIGEWRGAPQERNAVAN